MGKRHNVAVRPRRRLDHRKDPSFGPTLNSHVKPLDPLDMTDLLLTATLIAAAVATVACAPEPARVAPAPTATGAATALTMPSADSCLDVDAPSPRPLDPAAHVYDTAVHSYLHQHASGIGRELQGDEDRKALAVTDDAVYRLCIQGPENCLRQRFAQAEGKAETLALLTTWGAYAYDRALQCLIREGERYQGQGRPETYDERIAVHLVGAVLPVGTLRETDYYGQTGPERLRGGEANWRRCYDLIAGEPPAADGIAERVEEDLLTTIDCGDGETRNWRDEKPPKEPTGADAGSHSGVDWRLPNQTHDVGERAGDTATDEPTFGRAENREVSGDAYGTWYDCYDALVRTPDDIDRLVKAAHQDFIELLDCNEALRGGRDPRTVRN